MTAEKEQVETPVEITKRVRKALRAEHAKGSTVFVIANGSDMVGRKRLRTYALHQPPGKSPYLTDTTMLVAQLLGISFSPRNGWMSVWKHTIKNNPIPCQLGRVLWGSPSALQGCADDTVVEDDD